MTRKDYVLIAGVLLDLSQRAAHCFDNEQDRYAIAEVFADALSKTNPAFSRAKFLQAATGSETDHVPMWCDACLNAELGGEESEACYFYYEKDAGATDSVYLCLDHACELSVNENGKSEDAEVVDGYIKNAHGDIVELGVYACSDECRVCNQ